MSNTTLYSLPGAFNLPSCSPQCIAAESALRFRRIDFKGVERKPFLPLEWIQGRPAPASTSPTNISNPASKIAEGAKVSSTAPNEGNAALADIRTSSGDTKVSTLRQLFKVLDASNLGLDSGLSDEERMRSRMISNAVEGSLFSLLWYAMLVDNSSFDYLRALMPGSGGLFAPSIKNQRNSLKNALYYATGVDESKGSIYRGLLDHYVALEQYLKEGLGGGEAQSVSTPRPPLSARGRPSSTSTTHPPGLGDEDMTVKRSTFFLGTSAPTSVDCYTFSAATFIIHGDFSATSASVSQATGHNHNGVRLLAELQAQVKSECPRLVSYAEYVRSVFFTEYAGYYKLRAAILKEDSNGNTNSNPSGSSESKEDPLEAADKLYAKGRFTAVVATAVFAGLYFLVSNAETFLEVLQAVEDLEGEEEEGEQEGQGGQSEGGEGGSQSNQQQ